MLNHTSASSVFKAELLVNITGSVFVSVCPVLADSVSLNLIVAFCIGFLEPSVAWDWIYNGANVDVYGLPTTIVYVPLAKLAPLASLIEATVKEPLEPTVYVPVCSTPFTFTLTVSLANWSNSFAEKLALWLDTALLAVV